MTKPTLAIYGIKDRNSFQYPTFVHDHNLCLMQDGEIIQYLQLERYTRRKYDNRLDLFIEELIDDKTLELPNEFDLVCVNDYTGNAFISQSGRLHFEANYQKNLSPQLISARAYYNDTEGLNGKDLTAFCCPHELAHIFSCVPFYGTFKENSLLVSFDGASSLGNYSAFLYRNGKLSLIENNWTDLGFASKFFNDNKLSFSMLGAKPYEHCSVPGKLMGFASWGNYRQDIEEWLKENDYFNCCGKHSATGILSSIKERLGNVCEEYDTHNQFLQDAAATLQQIFENAVLRKLESLQQKYHCDYLYYGGGCALNIVTNSKIIESGMFKDVFIAPCCNDSGLSIGAAAFLECQKGNDIKIHSPYLNNVGLDFADKVMPSTDLIKAAATILLSGGIIGVCNGIAEAGPRALGNRSLIALANNKELSQKISMKVKKREWYRPVAPIMLLENAQKVTGQKISELSRFMLQDFTIKKEYHEQLAGVVHANNTARIQTISKENDNPFMYRLLSYLNEEYGILALINTSFNAQGEPIVHTKNDAFFSAKKMNLDALIYNNKLYRNEDF